MLRALIRQDFLFTRRVLLLTALPFAAWFTYVLSETRMPLGEYFVLTGFISSLLSVMLFVREDKLHTAALTCSLPVTRARIVRARYLLACGLGATGVLVAAALAIVAPWSPFPIERVLAPRSVAIALTVAGVSIALLLPFVLRLGAIGLAAFLGVAQILGVVLLLVSEMGGKRAAMTAVVGRVAGAVRWLHAGLQNPLVVCAWALGLVLVLSASCALGSWLYGRRDM